MSHNNQLLCVKTSHGDIDMDDREYSNKENEKSDENTTTRGVGHVQNALQNTPPGSHNLLVYSDIRVLRKIYPAYIKSLLDNNEIVLILTYYDHPSMVIQTLADGDSNRNDSLNIDGYIRDGSLVVADSLMSYFNLEQNHQINKDDKMNFLSLIRMLLNHSIKNNKNGISIFSDMGAFFHVGNNGNNGHYNNNDGIIHNIMEYERSIPTTYKDLELKKFCLYHQSDYELNFKSSRQKARLLDCHGQTILIIDRTNNNNHGHNNIIS